LYRHWGSVQAIRPTGGVEVELYSFMTNGTRKGGKGQYHAPAALPLGKTQYPLYGRLGGPQGRPGQVQKISPPTGIQSPDRPACSQSLHRLHYPAHDNLYTKRSYKINNVSHTNHNICLTSLYL